MQVPPEMVEFLAKNAVAVASEATKKILGSLVGTASGNLQRRIKTWITASRMNWLAKTMTDARFVKTLWSFDQKVDLFSFYYPQRVIIRSETKIVQSIDSLRRTTEQGIRLAIAGKVGLGKTILARYLSLVESAKATRIPLFIELRRLDPKKSLFSQIKSCLRLLTLSIDSEFLQHLLKAGNLSLFLDGFDE